MHGLLGSSKADGAACPIPDRAQRARLRRTSAGLIVLALVLSAAYGAGLWFAGELLSRSP